MDTAPEREEHEDMDTAPEREERRRRVAGHAVAPCRVAARRFRLFECAAVPAAAAAAAHANKLISLYKRREDNANISAAHRRLHPA